jgi:hypothetical protein
MTPLYRAVTREAKRSRRPATLMRQLTVTLIALTVATFQTHAGSLDWLFDVANNDDIARGQAQFLVWDGVSHPFSASFEKVDIVDKDGPFYLFHVVISSPGTGAERDRSSYLVCFKLTERTTEFRIVTVIQNASDPPTENEIAIDKRLNRWPVSPPWKTGDDLPHNIKPPGLNIVLDKCRAGSDQ